MLKSPSGNNDFAFTMYAAHQQSIEDFIAALVASEDSDDPHTQYEVAARINLDIDALTQYELDYIVTQVSEQLN